MASSLGFAEFICEQLSDSGNITYKKMFGEFGLYCNGKYFALICDDRLLIKDTKAGSELLPNCKKELPYDGAKTPMLLIEDVENRELLTQLTTKTCEELPMQKPRKPRVKKGE